MVATNPNFVAKQHAIYDVIRAQAAARQEAAAAEAQFQAIADENNANCASYVPPMNHQADGGTTTAPAPPFPSWTSRPPAMDMADDFYNVSLVVGYNMPMVVAPPNANCEQTSYPADLNGPCPPELRVVVAHVKVAYLDLERTRNVCGGGVLLQQRPRHAGDVRSHRPLWLFKATCPRDYSYACEDGSVYNGVLVLSQ
nr:thaumatin-like protein 1 [Aegilops tauschii subsp. strangulata]